MELKPLEHTFFRDILDVELDVPILATLKCPGKDFDIIVVPEIAPEGYFRMKYFNAQDSDPGSDDVGPLRGRNWEYSKLSSNLGTSLGGTKFSSNCNCAHCRCQCSRSG